MTLQLHVIAVIIFTQLSAASLSPSKGHIQRKKQDRVTSSFQDLILESLNKLNYCAAIEMSEKLSAFVLGATGEVGKAIVKELAKRSLFDRVTLITRRKVDLPDSDQEPGSNYSKFDQKIVDFDKLSSDHAADFIGYDVGFCALGSNRAKGALYIKVDHDYVVDSAKLAKSGGCKHFNLVTTTGANKDSYFMYTRVKGESEAEITEMGFERFSIWHPSVLLCDRRERGTLESIVQFLAQKLDRRRAWSIEVPHLAQAIVNNCFKPAKSPVEIIENREANRMQSEN